MNADSADESVPPRFTFRRVIFVIALVLVVLCGVAAVAEQLFCWKPPEVVKQAIKIFRNR